MDHHPGGHPHPGDALKKGFASLARHAKVPFGTRLS
jgi:hypothetical protein